MDDEFIDRLARTLAAHGVIPDNGGAGGAMVEIAAKEDDDGQLRLRLDITLPADETLMILAALVTAAVGIGHDRLLDMLADRAARAKAKAEAN